jgi:hypothetical protein
MCRRFGYRNDLVLPANVRAAWGRRRARSPQQAVLAKQSEAVHSLPPYRCLPVQPRNQWRLPRCVPKPRVKEVPRMFARGSCTCHQLRQILLGLVVIVPALWFGLAVAAQANVNAGSSPVYRLRSLQGYIRRDPTAWLQRTVRVHAVAVQCQGWLVEADSCFDWHPSLVDADDPAALALPFVVAPPSTTLSWLRGLPVTARFVPQPRRIPWGIPTDYALRLRAGPCVVGSASICYQAVLEDVVL